MIPLGNQQEKVLLADWSHTPAVAADDLEAALGIIHTLGAGQPDGTWLGLMHQGLLATWDRNTSIALFARARALAKHQLRPEIAESDRLARLELEMLAACGESVDIERCVAFEAAARVAVAATFPITQGGQFVDGFSEAVFRTKQRALNADKTITEFLKKTH